MRAWLRKWRWRNRRKEAQEGKASSGHLDTSERSALFARHKDRGLPK